jgi:predicted PurR-regulated permease PerM
MVRIQASLWGRRSLAVLVMTLLLLFAFFVPLLVAIASIVEHAEVIAGWPKAIGALMIPPPPDWVGSLPLVGRRLAAGWQEFSANGPGELASLIAPFEQTVTRWFLERLGGAGARVVEFLLTVIIAAILYSSGESVAAAARHFARRLAGPNGENAVRLAGQAIRGVALGVVVTALAQAALGGLGLLVAGVPLPGVLTGVMFLLSLAQIGPLPVLLLAVGWLYWKGQIAWAVALLIWSVLIGRLDSVLLPILIKRGADLPLLLVFAGVIGGLIAFGLIGIFIGPVVLAVSYRLLEAWVLMETAADGKPNEVGAMTSAERPDA